ncbi:integrase [Acidithiobacillus caldus]|jgi:site-specific recombinase XerD|uniref:Integrase n=1 Tax=Acidithiobacillus caldus TaxID=33059 RepID=A0A1E7YZ49_9PROT|nr:integrase [Acidithiobacillus caldus]
MIDIDHLQSRYQSWISGPNFRNPYSEATIRLYTLIVEKYLEYLDYEGVMDIKEANEHLIRKYVTKAARNGGNPSPSTQTARTAAIISLYDMLEFDGDISGNPARSYHESRNRNAGGKGGRSPIRLRPVLELREIERLMRVLSEDQSFAALRDHALVSFILDTALRASEVIRATIDDLDGYLRGRMRVVGKGDKERLIRFEPEYTQNIRAYLRVRSRVSRGSDILFLTDQGKAIDRNGLHTIIRRKLLKAGLSKPQSGPHLLRHTAASLWLAKGMDIRQVQENLGHSNIAITSRYLHLLDAQDQQ